MTSKIYVASRRRHAKMWRDLRKARYPIISRWIDYVDEGGLDHVGVNIETLWSDILLLELQPGNCNGLVLYAESGDFPLTGALVEVGMALAIGHRVRVVIGPGVKIDPENQKPLGSWISYPAVSLWGSLDDAFHSFEQPERKCIPKEDVMRW